MILATFHSRSFIGAASSVLAITVCYAAAGAASAATDIVPNSQLSSGSIQQRGVSRLIDEVNSAMISLEKGRSAYRMGNYEEALREYKDSLSKMPQNPSTLKRRVFIEESIADASIAVAQQLMKVGRYDEARRLLQEALEIKPGSKLVQLTLDMLDDPIRNNPAKTPELMKNVSEVERLLALAYGSFDLGQYDDADKKFQSVLSIDPYNVAARRGLEQVSRRKDDYYNTARTQMRANVLNEVSRQWEKAVPPKDLIDVDLSSSNPLPAGVRSLDDKLSSIIFPRIDLQDIDLLEAVDFLRNQSIALDSGASVESEKGVNITLNLGDPTSDTAKKILSKRFNLKLAHVPLKQALEYIASVTGTVVRPNAFTVEVTPAADDSSYLMTKVIPVPPGFLSGMSDSGSGDGGEVDPFADPAPSGGISIRRVDPQEALKTMGITFPQGAVARYNADTSSLFVRNTPKNIQAVEDFVRLKASEQRCQVVVSATFIEVSEKRLKELGFDWIVNSHLLDNKLFGGGGGDKNNPLNKGVYDSMADVAGAVVPNGVVTGGLRSLNQITHTDGVDALIQNGARSAASQYDLGKGPSFFTLRGSWSSVDLAFVMRGLDQKTGVDMLQKPSLIVRPGEKATFFAGREMPYPEEYEAPQLPTNSNSSTNGSSMPVTPATPSSFEKREIGTLFEVEVKGLSDDKSIIDLSVLPSIVEFDGFINYGSPITMPMIDYSGATIAGGKQEIRTVELTKNEILKPVFSKKEATTSVSIATGHTIVLAGLKKAKNVSYQDSVPILGDIPLVGRLFRTEGSHVERKLIIIMLKADVIDPLGKDIFTNSTPSGVPSNEMESASVSEIPQP